MLPEKELTKEQLNCMHLLRKVFSIQNATLAEDEKKNLAEFLNKCIGKDGIEINKIVFSCRRKLAHLGIDNAAIDFVLDVSFKTRFFDEYDKTLQTYQSKTPRAALDDILHFAFHKKYHVLNERLVKLDKAGVCEHNDRLVELSKKCSNSSMYVTAVERFIEEETKLALKHKSQPGFFGGISANNEIILFFQQIGKFSANNDLRNTFHPKG